MLRFLKPYKKYIYAILFVVVLVRGVLNPFLLNSMVQEAFDKQYPGIFKVSSLSIDFSGKLHLQNFQIINDLLYLVSSDIKYHKDAMHSSFICAVP